MSAPRLLLAAALMAALLSGCPGEESGKAADAAGADTSVAPRDGALAGPDAGPRVDAGQSADSGESPGPDAALEPPDAETVVTPPDAAALPPDAGPIAVPDDAGQAGPDACTATTWYADDDGDGRGDPARPVAACAQPAGTVADSSDNCPAVANADQADVDGDGVGDVCPAVPAGCGDLVETNVLLRWSAGSTDPATHIRIVLPAAGAARGLRALRVETTSGFDFWVRYDVPAGTALDASAYDQLRLFVRGLNTTTYGWQANLPIVTLEDRSGARRTYTPGSQLLSSDGLSWAAVSVPLSGGAGWTASGSTVDLTRLAALEIHADTWDYGFTLDVDGVSFEEAATVCPAQCPSGCSGRGTCLESATCLCDLGAEGSACDACADGFAEQDGRCALVNDGAYTEWPNAVSRANSDPWLAVHHQDVQVLRPKILALNFVNQSTPAQIQGVLSSIFAEYAEASRPQGYASPGAGSQLVYSLHSKGVIDLRDGVGGRPAAPAGYAFENSTLWPRTTSSAPYGMIDYARFFSADFAQYYGFADPAHPGQYLDLCALVEAGEIHELWLVGSGDVPDAGAWEVLEQKPLYTATGNRLGGLYDRCAGNGCFEASVPFCGRSVRIGFVNYNRGPGCYMESEAHGLEHAAQCGALPALGEWFVPFGNFELDTRYGLPIESWYALDCAAPPCLSYPTATTARAVHQGVTYDLDPYDALCGNVHFPPNGRDDYDIWNAAAVRTSCTGFGRHAGAGGADATALVSSANWSGYASLANDCDGAFLVWWYQNMPAHGSGQTYEDGRAMPSIWPFLFY